MRVLLADADEQFLEVVRPFLQARGHVVEVATDGLECLSVQRAFLPDVLLLDQGLLWGGSDGVISRLREMPDSSSVPVIVMTDKSTPERRSAEWDSRGVHWLHRPFQLPELLARINTVAGPTLNAESRDIQGAPADLCSGCSPVDVRTMPLSEA